MNVKEWKCDNDELNMAKVGRDLRARLVDLTRWGDGSAGGLALPSFADA